MMSWQDLVTGHRNFKTRNYITADIDGSDPIGRAQYIGKCHETRFRIVLDTVHL